MTTPVDLLVVGGLTIDVLADSVEAAGGAARYATEGALAAGLRVALRTVAGDEPLIREVLERLGARADVLRQHAPASIRFEHHGPDQQRRLRLVATTDPLRPPESERLPAAMAVLFAPVAEEVPTSALTDVPAPFRAAGIQGWLREAGVDGWVVTRQLADFEPELASALRGLDLLIASHHDLGLPDGPSALVELRAWVGPGPELVVTAGAHGAWLDDGVSPAAHVPAKIVTDRHTIGAGDAFAAVLTARRGAGLDLPAAAEEATLAIARYLAERTAPTMAPVDPPSGLSGLDGTAWQAIAFGPGLGESPPPDSEFSLEFAGERLSGRSGCNRYTGSWTADGDTLTIGPLAVTRMACPEPLMSLEQAFLSALSSAMSAAREDDRLRFLAADGRPRLELVAVVPAEDPAA